LKNKGLKQKIRVHLVYATFNYANGMDVNKKKSDLVQKPSEPTNKPEIKSIQKYD